MDLGGSCPTLLVRCETECVGGVVVRESGSEGVEVREGEVWFAECDIIAGWWP